MDSVMRFCQERDRLLSLAVFAPVWFLFYILSLAYGPIRYWMHIFLAESFIWMLKFKQAVLRPCKLTCILHQTTFGGFGACLVLKSGRRNLKLHEQRVQLFLKPLSFLKQTENSNALWKATFSGWIQRMRAVMNRCFCKHDIVIFGT